MKNGGVILAVSIISLLVLAILGVNIFVWYRYFQGRALPLPSPTAFPESSPASILRFEVGPAEDEATLIAAVKAKVSADTGTPSAQLMVTISQNTGTHAKGNVKEEEAVGGGYWLAAKSAAGWVVVYHGQSQPLCSDIDFYDFPSTMAPECLNSAGAVVAR